MNLIFKMFNIVQQIVIWGSLLFALAVSVIMLREIVLRKARVKDWIVLIIALAYIVSFVILKILNNDTFEIIGSILFWIVVVISTQLTKHEDRKAGRRWWTR